jgi:hypothetical protein
VSEIFAAQSALIKSIMTRSEIIVSQVPAPGKLAPYSLALSAEVESDDLEIEATGRFVLLHDPAGQEGWSGDFRCVTFVRANIDGAMAQDPLLSDLAWSWLTAALVARGCDYVAPSGTVTKVSSVSYGMLDGREDEAEVEIRASWTPTINQDLSEHVRAWIDLIELTSGLSPVPPTNSGVAKLERN